MKKGCFAILAILAILTLSACQTQNKQSHAQIGIFQNYLVDPFAKLIHYTASLFNGSYGIAIILITLVIRLILLPFMLKQYKHQQQMKEKMNRIKPEMEAFKSRLKETTDPDKQREIQHEMLSLYKKHGINPISPMGCLPLLVQLPVLMGFYYAIRSSKEIASHNFMWFSLGHTDIFLAILAGVVYFLQFRVQLMNMPDDQPKMMQWMGLASPAMILIVSFNSPAALPLYWLIGGVFLIGQSLLAKFLFAKEYEKQSVSAEQ
ncbi:YidC/Oxa1 family membrane protein insertase [Scopulibacillus daqui]|uniref:Membrane protein insertase YidC n=1 Tax=Scopulibacillus daqui TaxID=1469162 RepID=A0ABS2PX46_9BACL|nr:membrane protein insertase YidC [Scopulibacillus daqui]MBM7644619.1 YidC/Oxa1 family membrane protein insertase [Scopulibacillus daqui]